MEERGVQLARGLRLDPDLDRDSRAAKTLGTASRFRIRISGRDDNAPYSRRDQGVGARRRLAMVGTGLEGDVERRTARAVAGSPERRDLGVLLAVASVKPLADDGAIANDDGADHRVRRRLSPPAAGE